MLVLTFSLSQQGKWRENPTNREPSSSPDFKHSTAITNSLTDQKVRQLGLKTLLSKDLWVNKLSAAFDSHFRSLPLPWGRHGEFNEITTKICEKIHKSCARRATIKRFSSIFSLTSSPRELVNGSAGISLSADESSTSRSWRFFSRLFTSLRAISKHEQISTKLLFFVMILNVCWIYVQMEIPVWSLNSPRRLSEHMFTRICEVWSKVVSHASFLIYRVSHSSKIHSQIFLTRRHTWWCFGLRLWSSHEGREIEASSKFQNSHYSSEREINLRAQVGRQYHFATV